MSRILDNQVYATLPLSLSASGAIGTAASTVDIASSFIITANATNLTFTLPSPSDTTAGLSVSVFNGGSNNFTMYGILIGSKQLIELKFDGTNWDVEASFINNTTISSATFFDAPNLPPQNGLIYTSTFTGTLTSGQSVLTGKQYIWSGTELVISPTQAIKTEYGKRTTTINDLFAYTTTGNIGNGWIDSSVGTWTTVANSYTLYGSTTDTAGIGARTLLRPTSENNLSQQSYIIRTLSQVNKTAKLGQVLRSQVNGDHYLMNLSEGALEVATVNAGTIVLELSKIVSGVKTALFTPITIDTPADGARTILCEFTAIGSIVASTSNATTLGCRIIDQKNGKILANLKVEDSEASLQNAGQSGLSIWQWTNTAATPVTYSNTSLNTCCITNIDNLINIVGIGDSITFGYGASSGSGTFGTGNSWLPYVAQRLPFAAGKNRGVGGKRVDGMLADLLTPASPFSLQSNFNPQVKTNIMFVMGGINDFGAGGRKATAVFNDLRALCLAARNYGYKVIVSTILPYSPANQNRNEYNLLIRANWKDFADYCNDFAGQNYLGFDNNEANPNFYMLDLIHPRTEGYKLMGQIALNSVNSVLSNSVMGKDINNESVYTPNSDWVDVVSTTNTLLSGLSTIDGVTLTNGMRVLLTSQTYASTLLRNSNTQNRIYIATENDWIPLYDNQQQGQEIYVKSGTVGATKIYKNINSTAIVIGTTAISWKEKENYTGGSINMPALTLTGSLAQVPTYATTPIVNRLPTVGQFIINKTTNTTFVDTLNSWSYNPNGARYITQDGSGNASYLYPIKIRSTANYGGNVATTASSNVATFSFITLDIYNVKAGQYLIVNSERYKITVVTVTTITVDTPFINTITTSNYAIEQNINGQPEYLITEPYGSVELFYDKANFEYKVVTQTPVANVPTLLVSSPISALTTNNVTLITVPAGKTMIIDRIEIIPKNITGTVTTAPSISIGGNSATYDDYLTNTAMTNNVTLNKRFKWSIIAGVAQDYVATTAFIAKVNVAQTGATVLDYTVNVFGIIK